MAEEKKRMRELIETLDRAAKAYYAEGREIMSNYEYDALYDELQALEEKTGTILAGSPTQRVGYEVLSELPKEAHPSRMLSLDKTKEREELAAFLGSQKGLLSWKLDGLTIVLTYAGGRLVKAVTRGNGEIGEVVTPNARTFVNLPVQIPYTGELVLRGEAVISYADFEEINARIPDLDAKYKNPRNLCSGSVRQLDSSVTAARRVRFYAFALVSAGGTAGVDGVTAGGSPDFSNSRARQFDWLTEQGFEVVEHVEVTAQTVVEAVGRFEERIAGNAIPSDGLVLTLDDIAYSASLGTTAKFPRDSIAFKWRDQTAETVLREIEWSASRTGLINPVAVFDPVELEGTTVSRASLHNISIMEDLKIGLGDTLEVYKANMIIPQVARNLTESGSFSVPPACPVCGKPTEVRDENGVKTLYCVNPDCLAKQIKGFAHFVSRDAMNIDGLSEMTAEKLIDRGLIHRLPDLFRLAEHREAITTMEGFGEKSFENLAAAVEKARHTTPDRLLYALGIPGIGLANARMIAKFYRNDWQAMQGATTDELQTIDGVGSVLAAAYTEFFKDPEKAALVAELTALLDLDETPPETGDSLAGLTFVITGSLNHFANRDELKSLLEKAGAKVAGSVSAKTSYLINNDVTSTSGKNKKARELGIPVIAEEEVLKMLG